MGPLLTYLFSLVICGGLRNNFFSKNSRVNSLGDSAHHGLKSRGFEYAYSFLLFLSKSLSEIFPFAREQVPPHPPTPSPPRKGRKVF